jgi:hypothetical protein
VTVSLTGEVTARVKEGFSLRTPDSEPDQTRRKKNISKERVVDLGTNLPALARKGASSQTPITHLIYV